LSARNGTRTIEASVIAKAVKPNYKDQKSDMIDRNVIEQDIIDRDWAFAAFDARDRSLDGRFVGAVKTTGIYCKPSCPARRAIQGQADFTRRARGDWA
jgi:hypothetical protein